MSAVQKMPMTPDAATLDLWRVAETGDVEKLASVLPRVRDINTQNEHGVTALMRAAQFGHVRMVRALLEQGADANIKRNDKFTALALAAFFGHTEIVRALMEHGADLQAATRHGTSPHMWATARTFNEVADQLENPAPAHTGGPPVAEHIAAAPAPAPRAGTTPAVELASAGPVVRATVKAAVVRTLKDPPEIWDLVHEEPRGFNPRSAFLTRLQSFKTGLAFRLAALALLIGAGVVGVMVLRGVQARNERSSAANVKQPAAATTSFKTDNTTEPATPNDRQPAAATSTTSSLSQVPPLPPLTSVAGEANVGEQPGVYRKPGSRSRFGSRRGERVLPPQVDASAAAQPATLAPAKTSPETRPDVQAKTKQSSTLSPQMIAPAKSATPKGKVIQWP